MKKCSDTCRIESASSERTPRLASKQDTFAASDTEAARVAGGDDSAT